MKSNGLIPVFVGSVLFLFLFFLAFATSAHEHVVVVPLSSGGKTSCNAPDEVLSAGGLCWKDRNLGASQVATSVSDSAAYGDLYQWGRLGDGHQNRNSTVQLGDVPYDIPGNNLFFGTYGNWRDPENNNLWQGIGGINNPCPQGFRIPTRAEFETEVASWGNNPNYDDAYDSPLKLVAAGRRNYNDGYETSTGSIGYYWTSTIGSAKDRGYVLAIDKFGVSTVGEYYRSYGFSVRCIKD